MDESHREADLRLDEREIALEFGAIVPGSPEESELIRRVSSEDPDERMPPTETGKRLTEAEIAKFRTWIDEGAEYTPHWAYEAPRLSALPQVAKPEWCRNEIDYFILNNLEREKLSPELEADPYRLIRRLSLDLTGLPPSAADADAFAADPSDEAYEGFVDRYLESPAYGEHWARNWLDLARYADTCGYEKDSPRTIWPFRDWVINALNADMPFDQFTIEQIAGDLLPDPTKDQIIATAFHRNTMQNDEGGVDHEEFRVAAVVDRVNTTMQVWMGTTMGCARCHSHKYDPLTQREYYELFAFFNQTADANRYDQEPLLVTPSPDDKKLETELNALLAQNKVEFTRQVEASRAEQLEWEAAVREGFEWQPFVPSDAVSSDGQTCEILDDSSVKVSGNNSSTERYEVKGSCDLNNIAALRLEALPDPSDPSPPDSSSFLLSRIRVLPQVMVASQGVRYVRCEIPNHYEYLKMAEVQVYSGEENIAPAGTATQSSTAYEGYPQLAIDGRTDPDFGGGRSTAHTAFDFNPWWEVDLGKTASVDRVSLWASAENQFRLKGAQFTLLDASRNPLWKQKVHFAPDMTATFHVSTAPYPQIVFAGADSELKDYPAIHAIENRDVEKHGWSPDIRTSETHALYVGFEEPWKSEEPLKLKVLLEQHDEKQSRPKLRHFRISVTDDPSAARAATVPSEIREIAKIPPDVRSKKQSKQIDKYYQSIHPKFRELALQRKDIEIRMTEELKLDKTPIMKELPSDEHRKTYVQIRGNFLDKGEAVEAGTPKVFHVMKSDEPRNRLGLARWLVDRREPAHGEGRGQSAMGTVVWHRHRADQRRLRFPGNPTHQSRPARLASARFDGPRLVAEASDEEDCNVGRLPPVVSN